MPGLIGLGVAVLLLWWTLRDIDLRELGHHLARVKLLPFLATALLATVVFVVRTVRWRYILRLEGQQLPFVPLWHATAIGFMANNLLPARTGELARAYAVHKMTAVRFSTAAASIAVSRVMDGIAVVALLAVAAAAGGFDPTTTILGLTLGQIMTGMASVFAGVLAASVVVVHAPQLAIRVVRFLARYTLPLRWREKPVQILQGLLEGLDVLRDWRRFAVVTAWSFVVWGVNGLSFWACTFAFQLDVPTSAPFVLQSMIAFGVAIAPTPGYFGAFEAVSRATLTLYGVAPEASVSYAVGYHIITFIPITLLGLWSLTRAHLHLSDLGRVAEKNQEHRPEAARTPTRVP